MTVRDRGATTLAAFQTTVKPRHFGRGAGLVDKDQLVGIKLRREFAPNLARRRDIGPILLGCVRAFFEGYAVTVSERHFCARRRSLANATCMGATPGRCATSEIRRQKAAASAKGISTGRPPQCGNQAHVI